MRFKSGEKVSILKENECGIVMSYKTSTIVILQDKYGFTQEYPENELVEYNDNQGIYHLEDFSHTSQYEEDEFQEKNPEFLYKENDFWTIDLHTQSILESERGWTNSELLEYQMKVFRYYFERVRENKIHKMIVIHGVGKGVLRDKVRDFIQGLHNLEFYDADFTKYGKGATEIRLWYPQS